MIDRYLYRTLYNDDLWPFYQLMNLNVIKMYNCWMNINNKLGKSDVNIFKIEVRQGIFVLSCHNTHSKYDEKTQITVTMEFSTSTSKKASSSFRLKFASSCWRQHQVQYYFSVFVSCALSIYANCKVTFWLTAFHFS